ncbi:MAG: hypothetical protein Q7R89_02000 [bacterium]|nr:hypothetical protein [bacterium]
MNMKKTLVLMVVLIIMIPQVAFAAWWNPFSWSIFSWIFASQPAAVIQTLEIDEVATSTQEVPIATTTATTTKSDIKKDSVEKPVVKPAPTPKPQAQQTTYGQTTTSATQTTSATTTNYKDAELELIKQQNEILKGQLEAQQKIAQNTTSVNGSCSTTLNICTTGTLNDVADTSTHYLWSCKGVNGGVTASCSLYKPVSTPACYPNWQTGSWSACTNSQQTRIVTDSNSCGISTSKPTETQSCSVYFLADISFDKDKLGNNGVDLIKVNIKIKDSNGNIAPNKTVQITTDSTINATSDASGEINTTISTTKSAGGRKLTVSIGGRTYDHDYIVVETNASIPVSVSFQGEGNMSRIIAPGKDQWLAILSHWEPSYSPAKQLSLKKVVFKVTGLDSTWISNIRIQAYPPPCSQYFCYTGNITSPLDAVSTLSSDGTIEITLASPLRVNSVNNDTYVYIYADIANPTSSAGNITYTNQFISAEVTGMVNGYEPSQITVYPDSPGVVSSRMGLR